jgi:hypothetical protein
MRQYRYDQPTGKRECQWNGPVWPFQTTQVLLGIANLLNGPPQDAVTRSDYARLLRQYADLHLQDGRADIEEDYDPETGKPIVGLARSHHYNHSGFVDLIVTGLVGLRPRADDIIEIDPLVPPDPADPGHSRFFTLQDVAYHGRRLRIVYDADGTRYGEGAGLILFVDGIKVASSPGLGKLTATVAPRPAAPIAGRINLATNLVRSDFPKPAASTGADPEALHDAIDGRIWFFPELLNGWTATNPGARAREEWFDVDFGEERMVSSAELAFGTGAGAVTPMGYRVRYLDAGGWRDVDAGKAEPPLADGITHARFRPVQTSRVRLLVTVPPASRIRLVELKLF